MPLPESSIAPISCWAEIAGGAAGLSAGDSGPGAASVVMLCRLTYRWPDGLVCRTRKDGSSVTAYDAHRARLRWPELDSWPATARSRRSARSFRGPRGGGGAGGAHAQSGRSDEQHLRQERQGHRSPRLLSRGGGRVDGGDRRAESGGARARAVPHRQGSSRPDRVVHLADPFDFQESTRRRPRRPRRRPRRNGGAGWHRARRRHSDTGTGNGNGTGTGNGTGRGTSGRSGRAAVAVQWRLDARADEGEVRRDHHAGLPAVHQGHLPGRHAHGPVLGPVR